MKKIKFSKGFKIIIIILFTILFLTIFSLLLPENFNDKDNDKLLFSTAVGMSDKDRIADFNDICNELESNAPMIFKYESLYKISYTEIKKYYYNLILNCKSDFEYYAYLAGFFNNIPSGHLKLCYPNMEYLTFRESFINADNYSFVSALNYWENILKSECEKYYDFNEEIYSFTYFEGNYYSLQTENTVSDYAKLTKINEIPVDEYIKISPMYTKLQYDHINKKSFREYLIFNDSYGEKCTIEFETQTGKKTIKECYLGIEFEVVHYLKPHFISLENINETELENCENPTENIDFTSNEIEYGSVYSYKDIENNLLYFKLDSFKDDGLIVVDIFKNTAKDIENIIIDLRENQGGYIEISEKLISEIISEDIIINDEIFYTKSAEKHYNEYIENYAVDIYNSLSPRAIKANTKDNKNIYVLISSRTLSAADDFTAVVKDNNLGTIIGANTQGERYGTPFMNISKISELPYNFTPFCYINPDGTDNSTYGTSPDIYIEYTLNSRIKKQEILKSNNNPEKFENRLLWDNVLMETIEKIKEMED